MGLQVLSRATKRPITALFFHCYNRQSSKLKGVNATVNTFEGPSSDDEADNLDPIAKAEAEGPNHPTDNEADNLDSQTIEKNTNSEETRRNVLR